MPGMSYPGGKSGAGVFQTLINEIPPHAVYVAAFAGHDAIARHKRPAERNILIDLDPEPLDWWAEYSRDPDAGFSDSSCRLELHNCDSLAWLRFQFELTLHPRPPSAESPPAATCDRTARTRQPKTADPASVDRAARYQGWFCFLDPPYLMSTRSGGKLYRCEFDESQHTELLAIVQRLPCKVMLCGYPSKMYDDALGSWRKVEYFATARSGQRRKEIAWCNYPAPAELHDSRFVGGDKRQREKVRRRIKRLSSNLARLSPHERQAVIDSVSGV